MARRAEQIHGIEPRYERRPRVVQDGVSSRRDLEQAMGAGIDATVAQLVELAFYATRRAIHHRATKPHSHDVFKAGFLIGEAGKEVPNGKLRAGRGAFLRHAILMAELRTWVKGINGIGFER